MRCNLRKFARYINSILVFWMLRRLLTWSDMTSCLLLSRGLPPLVVRLLHSWYVSQNLRVRWDAALSHPFVVSNGVRQGGVLSPILFAIYLDELLLRLKSSGVGCHWSHHFAGALAYADDVVLLAPSASALRLLLCTCESFASDCGLVFNPQKTQLIKFCLGNRASDDVCFNFFGQSLQFADSVLHLGNRLKYDLSDTEDILLKTRYLIGAANNLFTTLGYVGPSLLSHLFQSHCLALYGCELWKLSSKSLRVLEVAFNNCLRRIWSLPANTHTSILHYCANMLSIYNLVFSRSAKFIDRASNSSNLLVRAVFRDSSVLVYSFAGLNSVFGSQYLKIYHDDDKYCAAVVRPFLKRNIDIIRGTSDTELMLRTILTS